MGDPWLAGHDACTRLGQSIMEKITERNKYPKGSATYTKQSAHLRADMIQFSSEVKQVQQDLLRAATQHKLTQREEDRRQGLLDQLLTKEKHLELALRHEDTTGQRTALIGAANPFDDDPWGSNEGDPYSRDTDPLLSVNELRQHQQQAIRQQDEGLESLSAVIGRQKQMALDIGNEVDYQNDLIDDIADRTDITDQRIRRETHHIKIVDRKSRTCVMWIVVVFLLVAIVVIAVVPFNGKP